MAGQSRPPAAASQLLSLRSRERGFYKQFGSKADLMAEALACGIAQTGALAEGVDAAAFIRHDRSREHRESRATGCTMAALGGDAARQPDSVRVAFEEGVEKLLALLSQQASPSDPAAAAQARALILNGLAHAMGALVMSRACPDDSPLADEVLAVCRDAILGLHKAPGTEKARTRRRKAG